MQPPPYGTNFTLIKSENSSKDGISWLRANAKRQRFHLRPPGSTSKTTHSSHGVILIRFVLDNVYCSHFLFLDSDINVLQHHKIHMLLSEVENKSNTFGIIPKISWIRKEKIPEDKKIEIFEIFQTLLRPCYTSVLNSTQFLHVVEEESFSDSKMVRMIMTNTCTP